MIALPAVLMSNWRLLAAGAALVAAAGAGWVANGWRLEARIDGLKREHADQVARASQAVAAAQAQQRTIELQRAAAQQEVSHVASLARSRADDDRRAADAAGRRLLDAARTAAARAGSASQDPAAAGSCETAASAGPVLTVVLERLVDAAGELAEAADRSRIAGDACSAYVDALTAGQ